MSPRPPRTTALLVLAAVASVVHAAPVVVLTRESAGAEGSVRGLVSPGGKIAGAVLWPAPALLEGRALPAGAVAVAAHAVLDAALVGEPGARPIVEHGAGFVALGAEVPPGEEARLLGILARLASPAIPAPPAVAAAAQTLRKRLAERWNDPLERARLGAIGLLLPGESGTWLTSGTPETLARVDSAAVQTAIAAVRRRPVEVCVAGPAGLAGRVAAALHARIGSLPDVAAPDENGALPAAAAIVRGPGDGPGGDMAIVLAFRVPPEDAVALGPALAVLVEGLSEGQGSLPQRLSVAVQESVRSTVEVLPTPDGGGVVLVGARVGRANAAAAFRVIDGTVASLRALPMVESAAFRARQRLDDQANYRAGDAAPALLGLLRESPWSWPPAGSERPSSVDVRQAAVRLLQPERRTTVAAGSVPAEVFGADATQVAARVEWGRFDPLAAGLGMRDADAVPVPAAVTAGMTLAREIFASLAPKLEPGALPGFRATYRVSEKTPLGLAESTLGIEGGAEGTTVSTSSGRWTVRARAGEDGAEAQLPGAAGAAPLAGADRVAALALREPLLLASVASRGGLAVSALSSPCGGATCRALRVELGEGTILVLGLDPSTHGPLQLRTWYSGRDETQPPDEDVRYNGWTTAGGARIAAGMEIRDSMDTVRELRLVEWSWTAP